MTKLEAARLAGAMALVSNAGIDPKKGLKLYRFYKALKAVHDELVEYEQKLKADYGIKENDNSVFAVHEFNAAFEVMLNEEANIRVEPFLTEEEAIEVLGKALTMEGLEKVLPLLTKDNL